MKRNNPAALICGLAVWWVLSASAAQSQPLTSLPGSPFYFGYPAGNDSEEVHLSPDGSRMFVANPSSATITELNVAGDGSLSYQGTYGTGYGPFGMVMNPAGSMIYVACYGAIVPHTVAADGTLTAVRSAPAPGNGSGLGSIVYVPLAGGDFVYLNKSYGWNAVSAYKVNGDGTLNDPVDYETGGYGDAYYVATPEIVTANGRVFAVNAFSGTIAVLTINADGSLTPIAGSPFPLPTGIYGHALAIDPAGTSLYVGAFFAKIVKFTIGGDGSLTPVGAFGIGLCSSSGSRVLGIRVTPNGAYVVATVPTDGNNIAVLNTATMRYVEGSPVWNGYYGSANTPIFNSAGSILYVGNATYPGSVVTAWTFTPTPDVVDTLPPTTTASLYGSPKSGDWYEGNVRVYLNASDPDSLYCELSTYYVVDGGPQETFYGEFVVSGDGFHTIEYWSVDAAGHEEMPHNSVTFAIDAGPPSITESVVVTKVKGQWLATASGKVTDIGSGVDPSSASFKVYDEYGLITPSGPLTLHPDGSYSFNVTLGGPKALDKDGRTFEFQVKAKDMAGNAGSRTVLVFVTK